MRTIRTLTAGLACVAFLPALAAAQSAPPSVPQKARSFTDSWYWGAKGGVSMFSSATEDISAPSVGAEWMITRTRVAMYLSVEQAFFETEGAVFDPTSVGGDPRTPVGPDEIERMSAFKDFIESLDLDDFEKRRQ